MALIILGRIGIQSHLEIIRQNDRFFSGETLHKQIISSEFHHVAIADGLCNQIKCEAF